MLLSNEYGILIPFIAITSALAATWIILFYADKIQQILGDVITDIMGKVLGMFLAAIAIKIIWSGIRALSLIGG
jgi:multiple antibiotic resistance protein